MRGWYLAALVVLAVCLFLLRRRARRALGWVWSKRKRRAVTVSAENLQVEFYRRFEALLARRGLKRRPNQTQLEFARFAGHHLAEGPVAAKGEPRGAPPTLAAVRRLVDSFYRVRFGHAALDSRQGEAVEQVLDQLEQSVGRAP